MPVAQQYGDGRGILAHFVRHKTLANLLMVLMIAAGLVAATRIRAQYFPDVVISEVSVSVVWEGAGAEDVDHGIVQVLEPVLLAVDGVTDSLSHSTEGLARITLEFEPGHDLAQATEDVQAAVDAVSDLPDGAEDPKVRRGAWRDRVTDIVITGPVGVDQLGRFADELVGRLFAQGVTRTTIQGLAAAQVVVEVPSVALIRHDISMAEIAAAVAAGVQTAPAGDMGAAARLRTGTEARSVAAVAAVVLRSGPDGTKLTVGDMARVRSEGADTGRAFFVGPDPAMVVRVDRNNVGDAIRLQAAVAAVAAEMRQSLPEGVRVDLVRKRADQISDRLLLMWDDAMVGFALLAALLFLFLDARTAFWVAMGIPVSMLATVAVMYAFGITINMISLFALFITLGILADDAIVVGEHAEYRVKQLGEDPFVAAENAARKMASPVVASTLTTMMAFGALMAIGGNFGSILADIPFTVIVVLLASLVECFLILPRHMAHALVHSGSMAWYDWPSRTVMRGFGVVQRRVVHPGMQLLIKARYPVLALAVLALASQAALFIRGDLPFRFFNGPEQATVTGNFAMLPGAERADTLAMMRELQRAAGVVAARFEAEHGSDPISSVLAEVGGGSGRGPASADTKDADLLGGISMELIDPDLRPYPTSDFVAAMEAEVNPHPRLEELSFRGLRHGPGGDSLSVDLYGTSAESLKAAAEAMKRALAPFPEVSGLEDSLAYDKQDVILNLTPQGQALGFSIDALGLELRNRLNGIEAVSFPDGPRSATIRVELPADEVAADFLERTLMRAAAGVYVPLADIVTVTRRSGFSTILRENGLRVVSVTGALAEDNPARADEVQRLLEAEILPQIEADFGVTSRLTGLAEQERDFLGDAWIGLLAALGGIYLVLSWTIASWTRPLVVMSVIPFGMVGAIYGHDAWGVPLSMFSIVGMIGMTGIIVNDSIVLVSTVDEYAETRGLHPAIADAVTDRLRPVMLTTLTTVLGLAPFLSEKSSQAEFLKPTVITLVYGLGFGMVLVLLVVPALLAVQADLGRQVVALRRMLRGGTGWARGIVLAAAGLVAVLFVATLGVVLAGGVLPLWLAGPEAGTGGAAVVFLAGAALVALGAYGIGRLVLRPAR